MLLLVSIILGLILFGEFWFLTGMIEFNWKDMILYGGGTACLIVLIDLLLMKILPENQLDDGGINERIFANLSLLHIVILSLVIAISEELLFRGVIQTNFGLFIASGLFAIIHVRYLAKPVLFISVVGISFMIGILFELTGNVLVTITAHFFIDFTMGCLIKRKARI